MFCRFCGTKLPEDAVYCYSCGEKCEIGPAGTSGTIRKKGADRAIVPPLDEETEFVDVDAYWKSLGILKKLCFAVVMGAAASWAAILMLSFFI